MFTPEQFALLTFLEGRWEGTGPDGKPFFEQYRFENPTRLRPGRFADATFSAETDHSVVTLADGRIVSTWKEFTWEASDVTAGKACFTPINAPSAFCWTRTSDSIVEVTQRWTDEHGKPQAYVMKLRRL